MVSVWVMEMSIVHVIDMTIMPNRCMSTAFAMDMVVIFVRFTIAHDFPLLSSHRIP